MQGQVKPQLTWAAVVRTVLATAGVAALSLVVLMTGMYLGMRAAKDVLRSVPGDGCWPVTACMAAMGVRMLRCMCAMPSPG